MSHNFFISVEIQDMPVKDQLSIVEFCNNFKTELSKNNIEIEYKYNHANHFWIIDGKINKFKLTQKIKGPKQNTVNEVFFRDKYVGHNFFYENEFLYVEINHNDIENMFVKIFKNCLKYHNWSIKTKWNNSGELCCRPIQNISISIDNIFLNDEFANVKFSANKPIITDIYRNSVSKKIQDLSEELSIFPYTLDTSFIFNYLIHMFLKPKILVVPFNEKFLKIPTKIIEYFLKTEQLSILLYKDTKPINKCLCIIEEDCKAKSEDFTKSVEAKLLDLLLQYERDISKSIEEYKHQRNIKIINDKIGTIGDKINRMKILCKQIFENKNILKHIDLYAIDITSEIVTENPNLEGCIARQIIENYDKYEKEIRVLDYIDNLINLFEIGCVPTGNKDQFGLKKQCDYVINYLLNNELDINLKSAESFFNQRLKLAIDKINPMLNYIKINRKLLYKYKTWHISLEDLNRIINLVNKSECNQHIELHNVEEQLLEKIKSINIDNVNEIMEQVILYVNSTIISPYIEKKDILQQFLLQISIIMNLP